MPEPLVVALIATATSLLVATLTHWITPRVDSAGQRRASAEDVNRRYLSPLRHQLVEATFRTREVVDRARHGRAEALGRLTSIEQLLDRPATWFAGEGCYLASTAYFTACLFAELVRLREAYPFLRLRGARGDTELSALVMRVAITISGGTGIYYAVQQAIAGT